MPKPLTSSPSSAEATASAASHLQPSNTSVRRTAEIKSEDRIALAPMEGVVDYHVRQLISEIGGLSFCVTEFLRITNQIQPAKSFKKVCPEILHNSKTTSQVPVHLQLLGNNVELIARHASKAAMLGAEVVDLNFGCPAKTVNRHKGGAVLLQNPKEIHQIVSATAKALEGSGARLTAKMRLGYEDKNLAFENLAAIQDGGATELTVHARTKVEGYKPPAHWHWIAKLKEKAHIPLIANGDVWSIEDYHNCREVSNCKDVMIGRGLIADPYLAYRIRHDIHEPPTPADLAAIILHYLWQIQSDCPEKYLISRVKQWLTMMKKQDPRMEALFEQAKICIKAEPMLQLIAASAQQERLFADRLPDDFNQRLNSYNLSR